jgi:hypothetical protein
VREECLEAAIAEEGDQGYRYGMRGGLTPGERARYAINSSAPPAGFCADCGAKVNRRNVMRCRDCYNAARAKAATCAQGHEYTEDNYRIRPVDGSRSCLTCERERAARRRAQAKAGAA